MGSRARTVPQGASPPIVTAGDDRFARAIPWLLILVTVITYGRLATAGFSSMDDTVNLSENARLNPPTLSSTLQYWKEPLTGSVGLYIPLTYTLWAVLAKATWVATPDEHGYHLDPHIFHATNILAHTLTVLAVYSLLRKVSTLSIKLPRHSPRETKGMGTRSWAAAAGAALFAIHPLQVESVGWACGLKDVLCGLFTILALNRYVACATSKEIPSTWPDALGMICFVAAMLCKPTAVITPVLVMVIDLIILGRPIQRVIRSVAPWFAVAAPFIVIGRIVQNVDYIPRVAVWARPLLAGDGLVFYLWKLAIPWPLIVDYGLTPQLILQQAWGRIVWIVPLLIAALLWRNRRLNPLLWAGFLLFVVALLPNSGLATFQFQYYSLVADHYMYLAMFGPALVLTWVMNRFGNRAVKSLCAIWLAVLMGRSILQAGVWQDDLHLTDYSLSINPNGFLAQGNRGFDYDEQAKLQLLAGDVKGARDSVQKALAAYTAAIRLKPDNPNSWVNFISLNLRMQNDVAALEAGKTLISLSRTMPPSLAAPVSLCLLDLGDSAARLGRHQEAIEFLTRAIELSPRNQKMREALKAVEARGIIQ